MWMKCRSRMISLLFLPCRFILQANKEADGLWRGWSSVRLVLGGTRGRFDLPIDAVEVQCGQSGLVVPLHRAVTLRCHGGCTQAFLQIRLAVESKVGFTSVYKPTVHTVCSVCKHDVTWWSSLAVLSRSVGTRHLPLQTASSHQLALPESTRKI